MKRNTSFHSKESSSLPAGSHALQLLTVGQIARDIIVLDLRRCPVAQGRRIDIHRVTCQRDLRHTGCHQQSRRQSQCMLFLSRLCLFIYIISFQCLYFLNNCFCFESLKSLNLFFKFIQFNHITLDFKHFLYKYNGFSPSIQPIPRFYFLRFSVYDMAGTNVPWHIRASRAVACDNLQLRASAHHWHKKKTAASLRRSPKKRFRFSFLIILHSAHPR